MRTPRSAPSSLFRFSPLAAAFACALVSPAMAATYAVTNTLDSGTGSLRNAMQAAQSACDPAATITFNIPAPFTIAPSSPLPAIVNCLSGPVSVTLDGYSQPGASQNTLGTGFNAVTPVVIDGTSFFFFGGCALTTGNFTYGEGSLAIQGLTVQNFTYGGAKGICGNVTVTGSRVLGNSYGISAYANAAIGGAGLAERNVITGNANIGVFITSGTGVTITNNYVGTSDGFAAAPNGDGIYVLTATGTQISGNVISGNNSSGINTWEAPGTAISNNMIGATAAGSAALGNSQGISAGCTSSMDISGNVVSGNAYGGMFLGSVETSTVQGNQVGVAADGSTPMANGGDGIVLNFSDCIFGSDGNTFQSNTIANNAGRGVAVIAGTGNRITSNSIYANTGKNIDLDFSGGPLPNDLGDPDTGPNERQNHPLVDSVTQGGGNTFVNWSLNSTPSIPPVTRSYSIELYSNLGPGTPAGKTLVATIPASTDIAGDTAGTATLTGAWDNISALAIDGTTGDTSEFSPAIAVTPTPDVTVTPNPLDLGSVALGATAGPMTITVASVGTANYGIGVLDASSACTGLTPICSAGPFTCTSTCLTGRTSSYPPGTSCTISVSFTPLLLGPQTTSFYICDNAAGSPRQVVLNGTGAPPPGVTISPASFDFGTVTVGATSVPGTFTVTNPALVPAALSSFSVSAPFVLQSTTCTSALPPVSSCTADVKFAPTAIGPAGGTIQVSAGGAVLSAALSGTGASAAALAILPSAFDFGTVLVGGTSAAQEFTINNPSTLSTPLTGPMIAGPFQVIATTCGADLAPMASCVAHVAFVPASSGNAAGSLSATSSAGTSSATLVGTGLLQAVLDMSPAPIDLGAGTLNGDTISRTVALGNAGNAPLSIETLTVGLPFSLASTCPAVLAAGAACEVTISLVPGVLGSFNASLVVVTNAPGGSRSIPVSGRVQPRPEPVIRVSPLSIGFGDRLGGTQSAAQRVTILNEGGANATGLEVHIDAHHFQLLGSTCMPVLAPQSTCFADVVFQPTGFGPKRGTLRVTSNAPTAEVGLSGAGCRPPPPSQGRAPRLNCAP